MTSLCCCLLLRQAFSELRHFSWDIDPARTMVYCTPLTMELSPKFSAHFVVSRVITFDSCSKLTAATPEKCANKFSSMLVELQLIGHWSLSGKGDEDLDGHTADEDSFGSLRCSQGALDSRANFLGTSQPHILYLWEFADVHDLLRTSFQ